MYKKKYGIIFFAGLLFITLPLITGIFVEQEYRKDINLIAQSMKLPLQQLDYHRYWFHSTAILATHFPLADQPLANQEEWQNTPLVIKQYIYHGPLIFYKNPYKHSLEFAFAHVDSFLDSKIFFAQTTLAFNKDLLTQLQLAQYHFFHDNQLMYSLEGLTGAVSLLKNQKHSSAWIEFKKLVANFNYKHEITHFTSSHQLEKNQTGIWIGKKIYHFDRFAWQQDKTKCVLKHVDISTNTTPIRDYVTLNFKTAIQSVNVNTIEYGAQDFTCTLAAKKGNAFKAVQDYLMIPSSEKITDFQQQLKTLLNQGAFFQMKVLGNTAWGLIDLVADIAYPVQDTDGFSAMTTKADGKLEGKLPLELANRLLTSFYQTKNIEEATAQKQANLSILEWQKTALLQILGADILLNLHWQKQKLK